MFSGELDCSMKERVGHVIVRDGLWAEAIGLAVHPDPRVAFRASWALRWAYGVSPEGLLAYIDSFVDAFLKSDNGSVHREYSKILYDMQRRRMVTFDDIRLTRIAEKALDLLVAAGTKVAVKAWCIDILCDASPRLDWVAEVLRDTLHHILHSAPSPGLAHKASKGLRKLG